MDTLFCEIELCIRDKLSSTLASSTAHPGTKDSAAREPFDNGVSQAMKLAVMKALPLLMQC